MRGGEEDDGGSLREFVREHEELLTDILVGGSPEAKAYALTLYAAAGDVREIERAQRALERVKREVRGR